MANTREGLIDELRKRGLTRAEAEQEVAQREEAAERIVNEAGPEGRADAVKRARAHLFGADVKKSKANRQSGYNIDKPSCRAG